MLDYMLGLYIMLDYMLHWKYYKIPSKVLFK